ncbi:MAG: aldehyde dehydrogenase family protein [Chloroflexi bacterium]|nr:aldehyde dehydrogenase family protein [Chloroflexota bacterium]
MSYEPAREIEELNRIFQLQKANSSPSNAPSYEERLDRLSRIERLCRDNEREISAALEKDFGSRNPDMTFLADIYPQLSHARHAKARLKQWMKKERTPSGLLGLTGQRTYILHEPLGVVGVMSPFNAPVGLAFDPAIDAIAAGNSVMLRISENAPHAAELIKSLVSARFKAEEMAVATGGLEVSRAFAALPWDKLLFTGGTEVGKRILSAAAENLTPVILELGGKSPCVILDDANVAEAGMKIARVRQMNAGQVCVAGDYALLPERHLEAFIEAVVRADREAYPSILDNGEFTSVIHQAAYDRLVGYIAEAEAHGCRVVRSKPANEEVPDPATRKLPLTLVVNPADHLKVSRNEAFGPILSVYTYAALDDAIAFVNGREKPLALYVFGRNRRAIDKIIGSTSSGGVTVNDLILHAGSETMGFGGVGHSGMGRYKGGFIGYQAFSNPKSVFEQGLLGRFMGFFFPPFKSDRTRRMLRRRVGL